MKYIENIYIDKDGKFYSIIISFKDKRRSLMFYKYEKNTGFHYANITSKYLNKFQKLELFEILFDKELLNYIINLCKKNLKLTQDIEIKEIFLKIEEDLKNLIH